MSRKILAIIFIISVSISFAQGEANNWYFGENAGITFNSGAPQALTDGALDTHEGCSAISDASGSLLFYSDGISVWNRNHQAMPNGSGLLGDPSSTQSGLIVPHPGNTNLFYVFSLDDLGGNNGIRYSIVNMSLDSGFGDVTSEKNILLHTPSTEKITAISNTNNDDIWVITHKADTNEFYIYEVTNSGLNITPNIIPIGFTPVFTPDNIGYMKISPDGTKLAVVYLRSKIVEILEFNSSNGDLSNPIIIDTVLPVIPTSETYGVEFSPDSKYLYVSCSKDGIYQFDTSVLNQGLIIASQTLLTPVAPIPTSQTHWALQLGPNGKIYVAHSEYGYLGIINNPNLQGDSCNYVYDGLFLNGKKSKLGLPPFIQSYFNIGFQVENICEGNSTQFNISNNQSYDSLVWDFGDGNTSTDVNPTHTYANAGDYDVNLTVTSGTNNSVETKTITIYEQPTATQPINIDICDTDNDGFYSFNLTNQNVPILNGQDATTFDITYYASLADYNSNTSIADALNYTNTAAYTSQTIYASVQNVNNRACEALTSFDIQVFESPLPNTNVAPLSFCDNTSVGTDTDGRIVFDLTQNEISILNGQSSTDFTVNYYTDMGLTNLIVNPSAYQNTNPTETIYVEVVNLVNMACTAQTSFNIEVYELPTVTALVELKQCDDDLDGYSVFNLTEVNAELSVNHSNETITFHETAAESNSGANPIVNTTTYTNETVSTDTIWARIVNANGCYRTAQVNLIISTTQIPNLYTRDFYQCDDGIDTSDGIATFDFSSVTTDIEAMFPVGQQLIITYYRNQADALSETDPIADISNYQNIGYPNQQQIFIRVDSALDNDCLGLGHHITLHVEPVPLVAGPISIEQCDFGNDGEEFFDTSNIESELSIGQTHPITFSYTDEFGTPLPSPLPNPFQVTTPLFNIFVTMTIESPNIPNGCSEVTSITLAINNSVSVNPVNDFIACDTDGEFTFDTSNLETDLFGVLAPDTSVTYIDGSGAPLPSPFPSNFTTHTQTITATITNDLFPSCFDSTTVAFIVNIKPTAHNVADTIVCDDISNDGEHTFTLSDYTSQVLNGQSASDFEVFYFETNADAISGIDPLTNSHLVSSISETVYARIQNRNNTDCYDITSFILGVQYQPIANQPSNILVCDDSSNDGFETVDLNQQVTQILNGQSSTVNTISYHLSSADAQSATNAISDNFTTTENPQTIYVRLENSNHPSCFDTTSFTITVNEQPVLLMDDLWAICENNTVDITADTGYDEYLWSTGATTQTATINTPGNYTITVANIYGNLRCETSKTITVAESNIATITDIETVDWTQNDNSISVYVDGNGDYEYSIDGISYQDENTFTNLSIDEYTIYVRDKNGCGIVDSTIYLMYYPKFFTPNGDGTNDTWQVFNSFREPNNKLYIYNRYGKLITELSAFDAWDGTLNGKVLPTNDYWFVLERQNGKTYRGHFTLKH